MVFKKSKWGIFDPESKTPHKISRSKIDLFLECPRCFYLDQRLSVKRPSMPAFTLNSAVDSLLKNEFDLLRKKGEGHELMKKYEINSIPFEHKDLPLWRGEVNRFSGATVLHEQTNLIVDGLVDDIWINQKKELEIVDYKSTSTTKAINLDDEYKQAYKLQMEIYQWIFKKLGYAVSDTGYFVFANALKDRSSFDGLLKFEMSIIPYKGNSDWVDNTLTQIKKCLTSEVLPEAGDECEHCNYRQKAGESIRELFKRKIKKTDKKDEKKTLF
jgi:hypothetical protein